jgi:hypothetical protein
MQKEKKIGGPQEKANPVQKLFQQTLLRILFGIFLLVNLNKLRESYCPSNNMGVTLHITVTSVVDPVPVGSASF